MSIKSELEKLISQGWFGKVTDRTEGKFFDDKEDVNKAVNEAYQAILAEFELIIGKEKEYANSNKAPEDSRDYEPAFVEGWNACQENIKANLEKE